MHLDYAVVRISGTRYKDDLIDDVKPGAELWLRREFGNVHDVNAVFVEAVVAAQGREPVPIGWVAKSMAARLAPLMDAGRVFRAVYVCRSPRAQMVVFSAEDGDEVKLTRIKGR